MLSVALLTVLLWFRDPITPEFSHFVTAIVDEEAHCVFIIILWLLFRNFLEPDPLITQAMTQEKILSLRVRVISRSILEMVAALFLAKSTFDDLWPVVYCVSTFAVFAMRIAFKEQFDIPVLLAIIIYFL